MRVRLQTLDVIGGTDDDGGIDYTYIMPILRTRIRRGTHMEYTTAEFRRLMAEAFQAVRMQDAVVQIKHHGRHWVSIVSPENASTISLVNSLGSVKKAELGRVLESFGEELRLEELIQKLTGHRNSEA